MSVYLLVVGFSSFFGVFLRCLVLVFCLISEVCYWICKLGNFTYLFIFLYSCHPCPLGEIDHHSMFKASSGTTSHAGTLMYYFCHTNCRSSQQGSWQCGAVHQFGFEQTNMATYSGARVMCVCSSPANIAVSQQD